MNAKFLTVPYTLCSILPRLASEEVLDREGADPELQGNLSIRLGPEQGPRPIAHFLRHLHIPATSHVLSVRHRLQMIGVAAASILASVVEFQSFRHRAEREFVVNAMSPKRTAPVGHHSVPISIDIAVEVPAPSVGVNRIPVVGSRRVVSAHETDVLSCYPSTARVILPCSGSDLATAALTKAGWVGKWGILGVHSVPPDWVSASGCSQHRRGFSRSSIIPENLDFMGFSGGVA